MIELDLLEKENILMICPNNYKEKLLSKFYNEKKLFDISFLTLEQYKKNYYFDYGVDAIKYLVDEDKLSPTNAIEILDNLLYVENKDYQNDKLNRLVEYKNKLNNKSLLKHNPLFKEYIKSKNIIVAGYGKLSKKDEEILVGKTTEIIQYPVINKTININEFSNIEEEVEYLYNSISDLLNGGIDINNIHLLNLSSEYDSYIKRYNTYYNFIVETPSKSTIFGSKQVQDFVSMLECKSREEIYDYLRTLENEISEKLINVLNKYASYQIQDVKELILNDIEKIDVNHKYKNIVKNANVFDDFNDDDYVFLLGFNDAFPHTKMDNEYISDNIKHLLDLPLTEDENELLKQNVKAYLTNIPNLFVSYSKTSAFNIYNRQTLFLDNECHYEEKELSFNYSEKLNKAKYSKDLDQLRKFNDKSKDVDKLYKVYKENDYLDYDNRYKKLTAQQIQNITNQINRNKKSDPSKLTLSYSSMNSFFECNFKYYLESVLDVKEPFGTYYTSLGTVCHGVLEDLYIDENYEFESSWQKQIDKLQKETTNPIFANEAESFFASKIKDELKKDIEIVKEQKANSILNKQRCENNFTLNVEKNIDFTGFIDKVMYKENDNEVLASVVDYKTSKEIEIDRDIMKYGLSLQLPSYLFLMKNAKNFNKEVKFVGFYIQHIINFNNKYKDEDTTLFDNKKESMKLDGISSNSSERISAADLSLSPGGSSLNIQGIRMKNDGELYKSSKLYDDKQFEELILLVEEKIKEAGHAILDGDFTINPKEIKGKNKSCGYCKYAPICYKRVDDLVYLDVQEEKEEQ